MKFRNRVGSSKSVGIWLDAEFPDASELVEANLALVGRILHGGVKPVFSAKQTIQITGIPSHSQRNCLRMRRGVVACMSSNGFVVAQQDQSWSKIRYTLQRGSMALAEQDIEFIKQHLGE